MENSEKLTALKRAYADIILNTAKEAAARVLAAEKKALRFQRELFSTKEEALQMLLRLKQMLDSKVSEAETASLSQRRKIEELEAQLQEAEDIVRDLRAELTEVQGQLEKERNNKAPALNGQTLGDITTHENGASARNDHTQALHEQNFGGEVTTHENGFHSPKLTLSEPSSQLQRSTNSGRTRNSISNGKIECSRCYSANDSHKDHCYDDTSAFATLMMMNRKEPELYRNGCTQRIRAFERNSLDGNLSISEQVDGAKNGTFIGREDEGDRTHVKNIPKSENDEPQKKVSQANCSHVLDFSFKPFRKKRSRVVWYTKREAPNDMEGFLQEVPGLTHSSMSPRTIDDENKLENCSKKTTDEVFKDPVSSSSPEVPLDRIEMSTQPGSANATESHMEILKPCSLQKAANDEKVSLDKSDLTKQESLSSELEVPACKTDTKKDNESEGRFDAKVCDIDNGVANQPASNRFIKYTFCRKRKKEPLSSPEDNNIVKRKMAEKQNGSLEPQNSSLLTESSRDSRRLAQVARQLISLSEKKWW